MPTLADIYSALNTFKRKSSDFVQNPGTSLEQMLFAANENAREFNKKHALATDYTIAQARGQQPTPEQTQAEMGLRETLAQGYNPTGMTVFHASPYKFNQFNASKIGSGEGNASYGIGHYMAESPDVAKSYLEQLKSKGYASVVRKGRNAYDVVTPEGEVLTSNVMLGNAHRVKDAFDANAGNLYKIDLPDEHIGKMLDWDKPLTKDAPQKIKDAFNSIVKDYPELKDKFFEGFKQGKPGNYYYSLLNDYAKTGDLTKNQEFASNVLQKAGIPGIRYLDEGSRNVGKGTSNFVVFPGNENMLQMLERNQQPIKSVGMVGVSKAPDYGMAHRPMTVESGAARLHDLTSAFDDTIYGKAAVQNYGTGVPALDREAVRIFQQVRNKPDAMVTVYRAVPKDAKQTAMNPGDWISVSKQYAMEHGESALGGNYKIVAQKVPAKHLTTNADSILEQGYYP
jgi:hypothetical protein